jgi:hypothetical protein
MNYNIIVIGAYGNDMQANHEDMCILLSLFNKDKCKITCYDPLYESSKIMDDIVYTKELFVLGDVNNMQTNAKNIIIEFCNLLDENEIHHGLYQHMCLMSYKDYNTVLLACGCGWNMGFPIECIMHITENDNIMSPTNALSVDSFLYVISSIQYVYANKLEHVFEPYLIGLYQIMGTFKWRNSDSEHVLQELFSIIGSDIPELSGEQKCFLKDFMNGEKQWKELPWGLRESVSYFVYKKIV